MKMWMIVTVDTELDWPIEETTVDFDGHQLVLRPAEKDNAPDIRLQFEHPEEELNAFETICRFLSAMSWWNRRPARAVLRICCTSPTRGGRGPASPPGWSAFRLEEGVVTPADPKAKLAVALYREAISVKNTAYEFLGYFKIVNILHRRGEDQIDWINATVDQLADRDALKRLEELQKVHADIGEYLYASGRCAVAHAFGTPTVDPDNPGDVFRLSADTPVLRALAEYVIRVHFGVANRQLVVL